MRNWRLSSTLCFKISSGSFCLSRYINRTFYNKTWYEDQAKMIAISEQKLNKRQLFQLPGEPCKQQAIQVNQQANRYQDQLYPSRISLVGRQNLLHKPVAAGYADRAHHGNPLTPNSWWHQQMWGCQNDANDPLVLALQAFLPKLSTRMVQKVYLLKSSFTRKI